MQANDPLWTIGRDDTHDGIVDVNQDGQQDTAPAAMTNYMSSGVDGPAGVAIMDFFHQFHDNVIV
jgi:hypothetical protein